MNLITLEKDSSNLIELFQFRPVPKQAWLLFESLTKRTDEHSRMYVSYFQQWLSIFPVEIENEDLAGISPDVWVYLYQEWGIKSASRWIDVDERIKKELLKAMNQSLAWVNSLESRNTVFDETLNSHETDWKENTSLTKADGTKKKKKQVQAQQESIWVPVVEELTGFVEKHHFSRLRKLECRIENFGVQSQQRLVLDLPGGNSAEDDEVLKTIGRLAQKRLISEHQLRFNVDATFRFLDRSGVHSGKSYGAAAYSILLCSSLKKVEQPKKYVVLEHVAMTGYPDEQGYLIDLDEEGLKSKLQGCFYSWINTFVVPETQLQLCRAYLDELEEKWPNKKLVIIGIRHIDEIFDNRRITGFKQTPKIIIQSKKIWKRSKTPLVVFLSLLVLFLGLQSVYSPFDKNVQIVKPIGNYYELLNKNGDVVIRYRENKDIVRIKEVSLGNNYSLIDLDEDGINEFIVSSSFEENEENYPYKKGIRIYSINPWKQLWEYKVEHIVEYPKIMGANDNEPIIQTLFTRNRNGKKEIYISTSLFGSFNSQLTQIDYETKQVMQRYVHPGLVHMYDWVDVDADGEEDLILGATNNAFYGASLFAVNPDSMDGNGPTRGDYISNYPGKVKHKFYILIENSVLANVVKPTKYPGIWFEQIRIGDFYQVLMADVAIHNRNADEYSFWTSQLHFNLRFDTLFRPQSVLTNDNYDVYANKLLKEGKLEKIPDYAYWENYMKKNIHYWNGERFQSEWIWEGNK